MNRHTRNRIIFAGVILFLSALFAIASQNPLLSPTTGTVSGLNLTNNYNGAIDSLNTQNSGAVAPTNQLSGAPSEGNLWLDTSVSPKRLKWYDGAQWVIFAILDDTNHYFVPVTGGGTVQSIASATTTDLCTANANYPTYVSITGNTTITGFGSNCQVGQIKVGVFASSPAPQLTNNASSFILPNGGNNIQANQGDVFSAVYLGSSNWRVLQYVPTSGQPVGTLGSANVGNSQVGFNAPLNLQINATVSANALTVAIKTNAGADAGATTPIIVPFRDSTVANGDPLIRTITSALSFTVASTNTMGTTSAIPFRLWVTLFDNAGTVAVCLYNASTQSSTAITVYPLEEGLVANTANSTSGGNSAGTHYCNVANLANKAFRIIGRLDFESGEATAGTWASAPMRIVLFGPGHKKPGDVVQKLASTFTASATATSATKVATTTALSITPTSAINPVRVHAEGHLQSPSSATTSVAHAQIGRNASTNLVGTTATSYQTNGSANTQAVASVASMTAFDDPQASASQTYTVYIWSNTSTTTWLGTLDSVAQQSYIEVEEIMGALEPANDNGLPLSMVG